MNIPAIFYFSLFCSIIMYLMNPNGVRLLQVFFFPSNCDIATAIAPLFLAFLAHLILFRSLYRTTAKTLLLQSLRPRFWVLLMISKNHHNWRYVKFATVRAAFCLVSQIGARLKKDGTMRMLHERIHSTSIIETEHLVYNCHLSQSWCIKKLQATSDAQKKQASWNARGTTWGCTGGRRIKR